MGAGSLPKDQLGQTVQIPFQPGQSGNVAFTGTAGVTSALANAAGAQIRPIVRITVTGQNAWIVTGHSSIGGHAVGNGMFMMANTTEHIVMPKGHNKIAAIGSTTTPAGALYFTERL